MEVSGLYTKRKTENRNENHENKRQIYDSFWPFHDFIYKLLCTESEIDKTTKPYLQKLRTRHDQVSSETVNTCVYKLP